MQVRRACPDMYIHRHNPLQVVGTCCQLCSRLHFWGAGSGLETYVQAMGWLLECSLLDGHKLTLSHHHNCTVDLDLDNMPGFRNVKLQTVLTTLII